MGFRVWFWVKGWGLRGNFGVKHGLERGGGQEKMSRLTVRGESSFDPSQTVERDFFLTPPNRKTWHHQPNTRISPTQESALHKNQPFTRIRTAGLKKVVGAAGATREWSELREARHALGSVRAPLNRVQRFGGGGEGHIFCLTFPLYRSTRFDGAHSDPRQTTLRSTVWGGGFWAWLPPLPPPPQTVFQGHRKKKFGQIWSESCMTTALFEHTCVNSTASNATNATRNAWLVLHHELLELFPPEHPYWL